MQDQKVDLEYCKKMPKLELHAHIGGSLRRETLKELLEQKNIQADFKCFDTRDMKEIFEIFDLIYKALITLDDIRRVTREVLEDFKVQNTVYIELRSTPKQTEFFSQEQYLTAIFEEIDKFTQKNQGKMIVRFLLSIDRLKSVEEAENRLKLYLKFKEHQQYGQYLVGLDFCGNPFKNTFKDYLHVFQEAREKNNIKITVHCAELPDTYTETQDVIDFKPDRLGHFNYHNQKLFDQVIEQKIPVEMCPTSNLYTMDLKSYNDHHFEKFFEKKHILNLNTDDTACFNQTISEEQYNIATHFNLNKKELEVLQLNACKMMFDNENQKQVEEQILSFFQQ